MDNFEKILKIIKNNKGKINKKKLNKNNIKRN